MLQLDKPIIHFQVPLLNNSVNEPDTLAVSIETCEYFKKEIQKIIGDKAYILITPFALDGVVGDDKVICVKPSEISLEEFLEKYKDKK